MARTVVAETDNFFNNLPEIGWQAETIIRYACHHVHW